MELIPDTCGLLSEILKSFFSIDDSPLSGYFLDMKIEFEIPDTASTAFRMDSLQLSRHLRRLAAVKSYECGELSQERAAELAGETRHDFLLTLSRFQVSPFQGVEDDLQALGLGFNAPGL